MIDLNASLPFLLFGAAAIAYGLLVHFWPSIKAKLPFLSSGRVARELDRENADLETFVAQAHAAIDKEIAALNDKKKKISDAADAVKKIVG